MSQVAVLAKLPAAPGKRDELIAALQTAIANAEGEPGTLKYILHEDAKDADLVWFYEVYADRDAFKLHGSSEGMKALGELLAPLVGGRMELTFLTPLAGKGM